MTTKIVFLISVLSLLSYCASIPVEEVKLKWGNIQSLIRNECYTLNLALENIYLYLSSHFWG